MLTTQGLSVALEDGLIPAGQRSCLLRAHHPHAEHSAAAHLLCRELVAIHLSRGSLEMDS